MLALNSGLNSQEYNKKNEMNGVNGCLWRTPNLWHTARTVDFVSLKENV